MRRIVVVALIVIAAAAAAWWQMTHLGPPNVRTALGLKFTLESVRYQSPYHISVKLRVTDERGSDSETSLGLCEMSIVDPSGKRCEPLERTDSGTASGARSVTGLFELSNSLDHVTVMPRAPLVEYRDALDIGFGRVVSGNLPVTTTVEKAELTLLNAVPDKLPDPAEWKLEYWDNPAARPVPVGSPAPPPKLVPPPRPAKHFALIVQWRFPDEYDPAPQATITDEAGRAYQSAILYSYAGNYTRQSKAACAALAANGLHPSLRDKALDKVKIKSLEQSWNERVNKICLEADAKTPRLYLYVFPTLHAVPKRFAFKTSITPPAEVKNTAEVVFRNVPVGRPSR